jgi:ectoine hydroxylase-related dioxygenase (phytanoyl-CoA dioxygenase family)
MTVWLPLDDVSESTGCLFYLPGSHRRVIPLRPKVANLDIEHSFDALMEIYPELRSIEPIAVRCSAGDVIVHAGLTAHAAAPNISTSIRRAYSLSYMPATATYNGLSSGLPSEYRNSLQPGDLLDNDSLFPKLYSH